MQLVINCCKIAIIIADDRRAHQIRRPSLDLSSRCSNLSRVLSPEHVDELVGLCLGVLFYAPCESATVFIVIYI